MQIFEFYFNPPFARGLKGRIRTEPDLIFDSFCYEPDTIYERKLGRLYMVGSLKNVLPQNLRFLEKLSKVIKEKYYGLAVPSAEKSLRNSLREANGILEEIAKKGDVSWLGNLSFSALVIKDFELHFTKVGGIKIFLIRAKNIIDIDKKLKFQEIEPYPLKVFGNIVSGKLAKNDLILVLTKEISDFFETHDLLNEIAKIIPSGDESEEEEKLISEKQLKEIFDREKEGLSKISGACLTIFLTSKAPPGKRETVSPEILKEFSLRETFDPILKPFQGIKKIRSLFSLSTIRKRIKLPKIPQPKVPKLPVVEVFKAKVKSPLKNKKILLILSLIVVLGIGFLFAEMEERQKIKAYQEDLEKIQEKINQAESFLILEEVNPEASQKANSLFKECYEEISPISKEAKRLPEEFSSQVFAMEDKILENLYQLNKLVKVQNPELIFEFRPIEFVPQKIILTDGEIYFFSPYAKNLFYLDKDRKSQVIKTEEKVDEAVNLDDSTLFFSKPSQIFLLKTGEDKPNQLRDLNEPYSDFNFDELGSFGKNLYFFDKQSGQIIKYSYGGNFEWGKPNSWLGEPIEGESMTIDGSIWILRKDNTIERYYIGSFQEKIELDIFPPREDFSKIFTSPTLSYLYILEPSQKRIIILNKKGEITKQLKSEEFDNLLDFTVSEDGKTIYLLDGLKVYKLVL